jgi:fatty-acyl-CoA synthase
MLITLLGGGRLVFTEIPNPRRTLDLMEQERCTLRFALAPMYLDELEVPGIEDRTFHLRGLKGGPPNLAERMRRAYQVEFLFSPYGMSEAYGPVCLQGLDAPLERQAGLGQGRPLDGNEVRIVDPESWEELPIGAVGEICMRGLVMDGYWGNPAATAATIDPDGWLHSGDLGQLDQDGYLTYLGRHKMMLKVGGENASPEEIESCIREMEGVHECAVVGVPDDRYVEVPWAYVVADPNHHEDDVIEWCRTHVAAFKVPRAVRFVPRLPVLGNGKLDRSGLAKAAAAEAATTVGRVP